MIGMPVPWHMLQELRPELARFIQSCFHNCQLVAEVCRGVQRFDLPGMHVCEIAAAVDADHVLMYTWTQLSQLFQLSIRLALPQVRPDAASQLLLQIILDVHHPENICSCTANSRLLLHEGHSFLFCAMPWRRTL